MLLTATIGGLVWGVMGSVLLASAGQVAVAIIVPLITTSGAVLTAYLTARQYRDRPSYEELEQELRDARKEGGVGAP